MVILMFTQMVWHLGSGDEQSAIGTGLESHEPPAGKLNIFADQNLGDLDGVERGAFAKIVGNHPEIEAIRDGVILANSANKSGVLSGRIDGHRI
jgi:hypothetical protein